MFKYLNTIGRIFTVILVLLVPLALSACGNGAANSASTNATYNGGISNQNATATATNTAAQGRCPLLATVDIKFPQHMFCANPGDVLEISGFNMDSTTTVNLAIMGILTADGVKDFQISVEPKFYGDKIRITIPDDVPLDPRDVPTMVYVGLRKNGQDCSNTGTDKLLLVQKPTCL